MNKIISIVVINKQNQILLLKRSSNRKSYPNKWNFISGTIEDESPLACANREICEELGQNSQFDLIEEGTPFIDKQKEGVWKVHPFVYKFVSGKLIINKEHTEFKWIDKSKLDSYNIIPGTRNDLNYISLFD